MRILLFDLDGTLVDTLPDITGALNHVMRLTYNREIEQKECRTLVGRGLRNALKGALWLSRAAYPEEEFEILYAELVSYYGEHAYDESRPYEGVIEFLYRMKAKGYTLGLLSNKADAIVQEIISALFPPGLFDLVSGLKEGVAMKPAKEAVEAMGFPLKEVFYIGDSEVDYETIKNSGIKGAIVTWGFRTKKELEEAGVSPLFDNIEQLEGVL